MKNVTTAYMCVRNTAYIIVHNCRTQHSMEQFWLSSLLSSRQATELKCCKKPNWFFGDTVYYNHRNMHLTPHCRFYEEQHYCKLWWSPTKMLL